MRRRFFLSLDVRTKVTNDLSVASFASPFNPITTPSLMKHWRDCCKNAPRELYMNLILTAGPTPAQHVRHLVPYINLSCLSCS